MHVDDIEVGKVDPLRVTHGPNAVTTFPQTFDQHRLGGPQHPALVLRRMAEDASHHPDAQLAARIGPHSTDPNARNRERTGSMRTTQVAT